ncbi:GNAT family N-acetyltransferase [Streptomyces sp. NPDC059578]|uniref:GNAT family N-acetyltransferase n=1 Tax=unclassified Streptomyces TaxID=2593676 RepID=UPI0036627811
MIRLRELRAGDEQALQRIYCPEAVRYLGRAPLGEAEARLYVGRAVAAAEQSPRAQFVFGVEEDTDLTGVAKLNTAWGVGSLSYILRPDAWGRGLGTEAVSDLLLLAFGALHLPVVKAKCHPDNPASGRVLIKAGFSRVGTERGFELYEICSHDWPPACPGPAAAVVRRQGCGPGTR